MILFAKHLALMSLALWLVPVAARAFARAAGRANRVVRPGLGLGFVLGRALVALVVPLLAQGTYDGLSGRWFGEAWVRFAALALAGALYGATFGNKEDFPRLPTAAWGALGGLAAAGLYATLPSSGEGRAICVALFATLPVLAYRPFRSVARRPISSGGLIVPSRRTLR